MVEYGKLTDELRIIVYTKPGFEPEQISDNTWAYPTNNRFNFLYFGRAYNIAKNFLKDGKFLVTSQDAMANLLALALKIKFKAKFQAQIHTDFSSLYFKKESLKNFLRFLVYRFSIKYADCVRVVSERIKKSLQTKNYPPAALERSDSGRGKLKTEPQVLPIFVDIEKIKNAPVKISLREQYPQFDFIILMASRLTKEKNIGMAIRAMRGVVKKYPKTGLIIIGEGAEEKKLKAESRKLKANIVFENWADDLASYYKTADLFLLTSNYEGYGRTIIEAMAASRAVVMTDVGIAGEIIKDGYNGLVVPVGDARTLEEALVKAIGDKFLRGNLVISAEYALLNLPSKAEYLENLKKTWENCAAKANKTGIGV